MGDLTKNFNKKEFACRCCGQVKVNKDSELVKKLQLFRDNINKPVKIISPYRCPKHNRAVGGAKASQHMQGIAVDITVSGVTYADLVWLAHELGFNAIGIYPDQNFVHLDIRRDKVYWYKYTNKPYTYITYEQLMKQKDINKVLK